MKKIVFLLCIIAVLSSLSFAEEDIVPVVPAAVPVADKTFWYAGGAVIYQRTYSHDRDWFDERVSAQDKTVGLTAIVGYSYNDYLAFEGRVGSTFFEESYAELLNYGIYIKPYYKFIDDERTLEEEEDGFFSVYALLGLGVVKVKATDGTPPAHQEDFGKMILDDSGFQWGLGLSYTFVDRADDENIEEIHNGDITIFIEYLSLMNDGDINSRLYGHEPEYYDKLSQDSISIGIIYRF